MNINTEAVDAMGSDDGVPTRVGKNKEFRLKWFNSGGYRGFYDAIPTKKSGWKKVENASDWVTGNWEDAGDNASDKTEARLKIMEADFAAKGLEMIVVCAPTSNVFSTAYDVFTRAIKK